MVDISIVNGIINQLISGGVPSYSWDAPWEIAAAPSPVPGVPGIAAGAWPASTGALPEIGRRGRSMLLYFDGLSSSNQTWQAGKSMKIP